MSWTVVRASWPSLPADPSPLLELFRAHGIENTAEEEGSIVGCLVDGESSSERLEALVETLSASGARVETGPYAEVDWDAHWREHFRPIRIGERLVVRPSWSDFEAAERDVVLTLDPGQAFGTGDHPTTRMCLVEIESEVTPGATLLDLGCGSGILAIAAARLGADATGVDIEPQAIEVARENGRINGVSVEWRVGDATEEKPSRRWSVVVSNIISVTLVTIAPLAARLVQPGGRWIVSGVLRSNWPTVRAAAEAAGFRLVRIAEEGEWTAAVFRR